MTRRRSDRGATPPDPGRIADALRGAAAGVPPPSAAGMPQAAVLVPILADRIVLTRRAAHLRAHAGQVCFPGGRREPWEDLAGAALRETAEEIGLAPGRVSLLGRLPDRDTASGFRVTPFVGWVAPGPALVPNGAEVGEIFALPLAMLFDPALPVWRGDAGRAGWVWPYGTRDIWGATAAILRSLALALRAAV